MPNNPPPWADGPASYESSSFNTSYYYYYYHYPLNNSPNPTTTITMQYSTIFAAAAGLFATAVSAQENGYADVKNNCNFPVYVQSFPFDGSAAGPLTTLPKGGSFAEKFRAGGSTVKIATTKTLSGPLFFGYSFSSNPDYAYYELSTEWGNPFAQYSNILTPGDGCEFFQCAANDAACYSTPRRSASTAALFPSTSPLRSALKRFRCFSRRS
ncbi:hypothetical protein PG990_004001 [Apiospora arundinis]